MTLRGLKAVCSSNVRLKRESRCASATTSLWARNITAPASPVSMGMDTGLKLQGVVLLLPQLATA